MSLYNAHILFTFSLIYYLKANSMLKICFLLASCAYWFMIDSFSISAGHFQLGLVATKPVLGVSNKASFKPVSSATEASLKVEISPVHSKSRYDTFQKANYKGAYQTARMCRLVGACVVRKPPKAGFLTSRSNYDPSCKQILKCC